nr:protein BOLA4, chloroplastic/mitochondrial [Ipomoea batatas]
MPLKIRVQNDGNYGKIKEQLNAESVTVNDLYGDGRHVSIDVVSSAFEGQSAVNRQRMVYKAIWEELQQTVHAVDQMTTKTPTEATGNK